MIEPGCRAVIVDPFVPQGRGTKVVVVNYVGRDRSYDNCWKVFPPVLGEKGGHVDIIWEPCLQRLPDLKDEEPEKELVYIEV
jgi:hypothetical protein